MTKSIQEKAVNPIIIPSKSNTHIHGSDSFIDSISHIKNDNKSIWKKLASLFNKIRFFSERKSNVRFIENNFNLTDSHNKNILHYKDTTSITLEKEYEKYIPSANDIKISKDLHSEEQENKVVCDPKLPIQFNKDFHRMDYFLYVPYRQQKPKKLTDATHLTAEFGRRNAQSISQFAHQGFIADPTVSLQSLIKDNNYVIDSNKRDNEEIIKRPLIIIEKTTQGDCIVTAKKTVRLIKYEDGEILEGVTISIIRKTFFIKGKDGLFLKDHDKKDQLAFVITKKHSKPNPSK